MGVYIRDMQMPSCCDECEFASFWSDIDGNVEWICDRIHKGGAGKIRHKDCPLVEVKPHGRLIDADALMRHKGDCYNADGHLLYAVGTGNILCAPTIIEAEGENG